MLDLYYDPYAYNQESRPDDNEDFGQSNVPDAQGAQQQSPDTPTGQLDNWFLDFAKKVASNMGNTGGSGGAAFNKSNSGGGGYVGQNTTNSAAKNAATGAAASSLCGGGAGAAAAF